MIANRPTIAELQAQCDAFNAACTVGGRVAVKLDGVDAPRITTTRSEAQILSGHTAVVWMNGVRGCYDLARVTPIPEPTAVVCSDIKLHDYQIDAMKQALSGHKSSATVIWTGPAAEEWTATPPMEQGEYWHWNGDPDSAPNVLYVLWSGSANKCFVPLNQTHSGAPEMCDEFGGFWLRMRRPRAPLELANA